MLFIDFWAWELISNFEILDKKLARDESNKNIITVMGVNDVFLQIISKKHQKWLPLIVLTINELL